MNLFERTIEAISPRWAAERAYFRAQLELSRAYDAAKTGRRTGGWTAGDGSANAEIASGASLIRRRARDLVRNNPWAASAIRKLAAKTIGTGIIPRLAAGRDEVERKRAIAAEWEAFVENCDPEGRLDFYGLQQLASRTRYESGEVLIRFLPRPSSWRLRVPLQLQVLEPDFLDATRSQRLADGGAVIQGVQYDRAGRRVGYWMFPEHPGDDIVYARRSLQSQFVPASEIAHVFEPLRPGQARGVSCFAPVTLRLRDADEYEDAELVRKKIAACFTAFVQRATGPNSPLDKSATTGTDGRRVESMSPGRLQYLQPGDQVTFGVPPSDDSYVEYMTFQLHAIAAGTGTTYQQLTGDLTKVNYSSARVGLVDFWDYLDQQQWLVEIPQMCRPVWRRFGQVLAATGRRDLAQPFAARWTPPARRWVDPVKEVAAEQSAVRMGLKPLKQAIAERGEDPEEVLQEIAETNAQLDSLGLVLESDPRKTPASTALQQLAAGPAQEEDNVPEDRE